MTISRFRPSDPGSRVLVLDGPPVPPAVAFVRNAADTGGVDRMPLLSASGDLAEALLLALPLLHGLDAIEAGRGHLNRRVGEVISVATAALAKAGISEVDR